MERAGDSVSVWSDGQNYSGRLVRSVLEAYRPSGWSVKEYGMNADPSGEGEVTIRLF